MRPYGLVLNDWALDFRHLLIVWKDGLYTTYNPSAPLSRLDEVHEVFAMTNIGSLMGSFNSNQ